MIAAPAPLGHVLTMVALAAVTGVMSTGCSDAYLSAATESATVTKQAAPAPSGFYQGTFRGDGVFLIGDENPSSYRQKVDGRIPPGRYRVEVSPGQVDGSWTRCRSLPCGPTYPASTIVAATITGSQSSELLDISASDFAVWLSNVSLTAAQ